MSATISSRYSCEFESDAGDNHTITVDLSPGEVDSARRHVDPELVAKAFALRHAYRDAPEGFRHTAGGVAPVWAN
jgi:hypothetical protein